MKTIKVEQLSLAAYKPFGTYVSLTFPETSECMGEGSDVEFYRDQLQLDVPAGMFSYSCCKVKKRPLIIDVLEYHTSAAEGVLPIDQDILLQVAPANNDDENIPLDKMRAFYVPKGTIITIRPGVWHWGPFATEDTSAHVLINLPERTYANDCIVRDLEEKDQIEIMLK